MTNTEFDGIRGILYQRALEKYPHVRKADIEIMHKLLKPSKGDSIIGIGEGNGFFCEEIAKAIGPEGHYLITDPSKKQLENLRKKMKNYTNIEIKQVGVQEIEEIVPTKIEYKTVNKPIIAKNPV